MYNHAPKDYSCPICLGIKGIENDETLLRQSDLIYKDSIISAFINSFFIKNNRGHAIIVPNEHYENLYDMPVEIGAKVFELSQRIALGLKKTLECDGITIQQNNEPAGGQHAFHYHMHIFPRYENDDFYGQVMHKINTTPEERRPYAEKLRKYLEGNL